MNVLKKINYIFNKKQKIQLLMLFFMVLIGSACELMGVTTGCGIGKVVYAKAL